MADEIDLVRSRVDIVELIGQRVALKQAGKHWRGLCPFHEDRNPSLNVSREFGRYKCWACGAGGDAFKFVMETQRVDFPEALRILADSVGVVIHRKQGQSTSKNELFDKAMELALDFFKAQLEKASFAKEYCERRGIDAESLRAWEMGYAPDVGEALAVHLQKQNIPLAEARSLFLVEKDASGGYYDRFRGRLMFPIRDERGRLVAFGGRLMGDGQPKYVNSSDTPIYSKGRVLYGMHKAKESMVTTKTAVMVEGYLDVIACHRAGVNNAVATLGTALSEDHAKLLRRWCDKVTVLYDSDAAGQKAADRSCELLRPEGLSVRVATMPEGEDPDTLLQRYGAEAVRRAVEGGMTPVDFRISQIRKKMDPAQDEFWNAVVTVLAEAESHLEIERHTHALAALYPGVNDPSQASQALTRMVLREKRTRARKTQGRQEPHVELELSRSKLVGHEYFVLVGLLVPATRMASWQACLDPELFESSTAQVLSTAIRSFFPDAPPKGEPSEWVSAIEPEEARDLLLEFSLNDPGAVTASNVATAISHLTQRKEERDAQRLREVAKDDNEALLLLHQKLAQLRAKRIEDY